MGLLWMGYHDAVREGDGVRISNYWVFLLPVFITAGRKNYSIEAVNIQLQQNDRLHRWCGLDVLTPKVDRDVTSRVIFILNILIEDSRELLEILVPMFNRHQLCGQPSQLV